MSVSVSKTLAITGACGVSVAFLCTFLSGAAIGSLAPAAVHRKRRTAKVPAASSCHGHHRFPLHASHRHGSPGLHGLPRRRRRHSAAIGTEIRRRAIPSGENSKLTRSRAIASMWKSSANPVRPYADWLKENKEYIQFVNPGDLRVAEETCGSSGCHAREVRAVQTSMMTHGAMLWQAALYNNGAFPIKTRASAKATRRMGCRSAFSTYPPPIPGTDPSQRHTSAPRSAGALGIFCSQAMFCAFSSAAEVQRSRDRQSESGRRSRPPGRQAERSRISEPCCAPIRYFWACRKRACWIPFFRFLAPMIIRAIIGKAAAPRAT